MAFPSPSGRRCPAGADEGARSAGHAALSPAPPALTRTPLPEGEGFGNRPPPKQTTRTSLLPPGEGAPKGRMRARSPNPSPEGRGVQKPATMKARRAHEPCRTPAGKCRKVAEPACKPGSVVDSHSSRRRVTATLEQPTRRHCGPQHGLPIWSCSRWGLPCRSVAGLAVRSYRTISPLPSCRSSLGGYLSVALSVGSRRPGVTWHRALWSPDFPRHRFR